MNAACRFGVVALAVFLFSISAARATNLSDFKAYAETAVLPVAWTDGTLSVGTVIASDSTSSTVLTMGGHGTPSVLFDKDFARLAFTKEALRWADPLPIAPTTVRAFPDGSYLLTVPVAEMRPLPLWIPAAVDASRSFWLVGIVMEHPNDPADRHYAPSVVAANHSGAGTFTATTVPRGADVLGAPIVDADSAAIVAENQGVGSVTAMSSAAMGALSMSSTVPRFAIGTNRISLEANGSFNDQYGASQYLTDIVRTDALGAFAPLRSLRAAVQIIREDADDDFALHDRCMALGVVARIEWSVSVQPHIAGEIDGTMHLRHHRADNVGVRFDAKDCFGDLAASFAAQSVATFDEPADPSDTGPLKAAYAAAIDANARTISSNVTSNVAANASAWNELFDSGIPLYPRPHSYFVLVSKKGFVYPTVWADAFGTAARAGLPSGALVRSVNGIGLENRDQNAIETLLNTVKTPYTLEYYDTNTLLWKSVSFDVASVDWYLAHRSR